MRTPILEITAFVSGAVLLALEVVASRVVAPYFGNSIYVWGSLIGVFLAALALGYFLGGIVADRWPLTSVFAGVVFVAGALVFPIPLAAPALLEAIGLADYGPRASPLLATLALFFAPSVVMGMVSPFAVRLRAHTVATIGGVAGVLYAVSTAGSIVGTLLAAFVLIPLLGVRTIIFVLGALLMILAAAAWWWSRRGGVAVAAAAIAILAAIGIAVASPAAEPQIRFAQDTVYHRIAVSDEGATRYLKLDNYWQSGLDLTDPRRTVFAYSDYMHLPVIFRPQARRVLMIGLGGGTVPTRYHEDYPAMTIDVVELDPAVVRVARTYFGLPSDGRIRVTAQDGRLFLARARDRYDIILLDAYLIDTIPFHLATKEFMEIARAHLVPSGVLASNVIGALDGPRSGFFRAVYRTFRQVFPTVYVVPVGWGEYDSREALRNIIIIGTDQPAMSKDAIAAAAVRAVRNPGVSLARFEQAAADLYTAPIPTEDVPILTDDYAPVEILIQRR